MLDFDVQRFSRRCAKTERDLQPGETFYSVLVAEGSDVVRYDYAADAWEGAPESALGWWKARVPDAQSRGMHWAPNDVMLHYFEELTQRADRLDERYVLALLLIRRRIVRLENSQEDDQGREVMVLYCPKNEREYRVPVVSPEGDRIRLIQQELARLLFADGS
jgi:hypothetical protein